MVATVNAAGANARCKRCGYVARDLSRSGRCGTCAGVHAVEESLVSHFTRYADDPAAQLFVAHFDGGATLEFVGAAFGISRERVRQIEEQAIAKLRRRLDLALARDRRLLGLTLDELLRRDPDVHGGLSL